MAFPVTPIVQTFTGADANPIGAPFTALAGNVQRISNQLGGTTGGGDLAYIASSNPGHADCEIFGTLAAKPASGQYCSLMARLTNLSTILTIRGYYVIADLTGGVEFIRIQRLDPNATPVNLVSFSQALNAGDVFGLRIKTDLFEAYFNGALLGSVTDSTYTTSGEFGVFGLGTTYRLDDVGYGAFRSYVPPKRRQRFQSLLVR